MKKITLFFILGVILSLTTYSIAQEIPQYKNIGFEFEYSDQIGNKKDVFNSDLKGFTVDIIRPVKSFRLMFIYGNKMKVDENFFLGFGLGIGYSDWQSRWFLETDLFSTDNEEYAVFIPIVAKIKYLFSKKKVSPFINLDLGGDFVVASIWKASERNHCYRYHGVVAKPGFGVNFSFDSGQLFFVLQYDMLYVPKNSFATDHIIHSFGVKTGFLF